MKECSACKNLFPIESFKPKSCKCKGCIRDTSLLWKTNNPEKLVKYKETQKPKSRDKACKKYKEDKGYREMLLQKAKAAYKKDPYKKLISGAKRRCEISGLPFNLAIGDLIIPTHCPVFGVPLEISSGQPSNNSPSLDRIVPSLGYVKGNVRIISYLANRMKSDASLEDLLVFANWLLIDVPPRLESFSKK